jgi:hypothetical protein
MKRREQIIDFAENTLKLEKESPEWVKFIQGATWADAHPVNYDGKIMLHVLNKGHEQGYKDAIEKAVQYVYHLCAHPRVLGIDGEELVEHFKKYMEEQQL